MPTPNKRPHPQQATQRTGPCAKAALLAAAGLALVVLGVAPLASASGACDVDVGSEQPFASIQAAVDAAQPGDTVCVQEGTYEEIVRIQTPDVTMRSDNGAEIRVDSATAAGVQDPEDVTASNQANHAPALQLAADGILVENIDVTRIVNSEQAAGKGHTKAVAMLFDRGQQASAHTTLRDLTVNLLDETGDGGASGDDDLGNAIWVSNNNAINGARYDVSATLRTVAATNEIHPHESGFGGAALAVFAHPDEGTGLLDDGATVRVSNSELTHSGRGLYVAQGPADVTVRYSTISHNDEGIVNHATDPIAARDTYWGSPTGPTHPDNPLLLTGASLHGPVQFRPWCATEVCRITTDGGQELINEAPVDTLLALDGHGHCRHDGHGGGEDDARAALITDATAPLTLDPPDPAQASAAAYACTQAALGTGPPDEGDLEGTAYALDGTLNATLTLDPDHISQLLTGDTQPSSTVQADGVCVHDPDNGGRRGGHAHARIHAFSPDEPLTIEPPDEDRAWEALIACLRAALAGDLPTQGSLSAHADLADGTHTTRSTTTPLSDALRR